jgi:hypothetical protein
MIDRVQSAFNFYRSRLPFGRLWYGEPNAVSNAVDYAKFRSRSHDALICVYDEAGNVIETREHVGDFKEREKTVVVYSWGRYKIVRSTLRSSRRVHSEAGSW